MADIRAKIQSMPKAELHAHLNGSLSASTIQKLLQLKTAKCKGAIIDISQTIISANHQRTLEECFQIFKIIHQLTDTPEAVYFAAYNVIKEFHEDNVLYLELRTTPREVEGCMSNQQYLDAVLKAIDQCRSDNIPILVKLLPSIDRSRGVAVAERTVDLTLRYAQIRPDVIIGLDVSGNMTTSNIEEFLPLLEKIRCAGLKLAVHTAEIHNNVETEAILRYRPDRLGHGTFISPDRCSNPYLFELLKEFKIPLELCLTSNVLSRTVSNYEDHHLKTILEHDLPFTLSTDDKGVFGTSLSNEYAIAASVFSLPLEQLWKISLQTIDYTFAKDSEKQELKSIWKKWKELNIPATDN